MPVSCENCGEPLEQRWKFCIHCGSPVAAADPVVPEVFRHADEPTDDAPRRRFDWQLALGVVLAVVGVIAIIYLVTALIAARG